ncbi:MAG: hypothetical protein ACK5GU_10640 [Chloroflexota bacterium]|jgi:hypothetical protein
METYSYVDDQDASTEIESVSERITFLIIEWVLILGWILTLLLVWRITFVTLIDFYLPVSAIRLGIIVSAMGLMIACVYALTMTGRWLRKRPTHISLWRRSLTNLLTLVAFTVLGRIIVWYFIDGIS